MLGVGIDWAEEFHIVAFGRAGEGVFETIRVEHDPGGVAGLIARISALEPDPAEVRVVLETSYGALVERLVAAGYIVLPVNPDLVARRRGPAKKKDDAEDARIACSLALDRFTVLRPFVTHGETTSELRVIARDDERAARDERRLLNRLRAHLIAVFPAAIEIAGDDLGAATFLHMLERWPTANDLVMVADEELVAFARSCRHGWPDRFARRVRAALYAEHFVAPEWQIRAKADTIRLTVSQLLTGHHHHSRRPTPVRAWRGAGELADRAPWRSRWRRRRASAPCMARQPPWPRTGRRFQSVDR